MRFRLVVIVVLVIAGVSGRVWWKKQPPRVVEPIAIGYTLDDDRFAYDGETWDTHRGYMQEFVQGNGKIAYLDRGSLNGEVVVLLHGTPTSSRLYRKIIPGLIEKGYRVIAPDMPGYGASVYAQFADPSVQNYTTTLAALLASLEVDNYTLAAHDIGSLRMRNLAFRDPQAVTYLIVFNSFVSTDSFQPPFSFERPTIRSKLLTRGLQNNTLASLFIKQTLRYGGLTPRVVGDAGLAGYMEPFVHGSYKSYLYFISHLQDTYDFLDNLEMNLSKLRGIRTLVIRGAQDEVLRADTALPVLEATLGLSSRDEHVFDDAGHFIQEQKPDEIVDLIDTFMKTYYDEERTKKLQQKRVLPEIEISPTEEL